MGSTWSGKANAVSQWEPFQAPQGNTCPERFVCTGHLRTAHLIKAHRRYPVGLQQPGELHSFPAIPDFSPQNAASLFAWHEFLEQNIGKKKKKAWTHISKSLQKGLENFHHSSSFISSSRASMDNGARETAGQGRCWHLLSAATSLLEYQMSLSGGIFSGKSHEPHSTFSRRVFYGPAAPPNFWGCLLKMQIPKLYSRPTESILWGMGS